MQKSIKTLGIVTYAITALLYIITLLFNYDMVSSNLDGWHNLSSTHAFVFAIICILLTGLCFLNISALVKNKISITNFILGIILIVAPLIFILTAKSLVGNIDTNFQYLLLRTFEGFERTYLFLLITSTISFITLFFNKKEI